MEEPSSSTSARGLRTEAMRRNVEAHQISVIDSHVLDIRSALQAAIDVRSVIRDTTSNLAHTDQQIDAEAFALTWHTGQLATQARNFLSTLETLRGWGHTPTPKRMPRPASPLVAIAKAMPRHRSRSRSSSAARRDALFWASVGILINVIFYAPMARGLCVAREWSPSQRERNRLQHALDGNGGEGRSGGYGGYGGGYGGGKGGGQQGYDGGYGSGYGGDYGGSQDTPGDSETSDYEAKGLAGVAAATNSGRRVIDGFFDGIAAAAGRT
jgi:hypothetical protein